jgi:uncharacterized protein YutE (UPF0331/DUF86 family)
MSPEVAALAEKVAAVERHLKRVEERLPATASPASYGEAFRKLASVGIIDGALADRLTRAAGFRNVVAHAYDTIDMTRVFHAATQGPLDLRAFLAAGAKLAETRFEKK